MTLIARRIFLNVSIERHEAANLNRKQPSERRHSCCSDKYMYIPCVNIRLIASY